MMSPEMKQRSMCAHQKSERNCKGKGRGGGFGKLEVRGVPSDVGAQIDEVVDQSA